MNTAPRTIRVRYSGPSGFSALGGGHAARAWAVGARTLTAARTITLALLLTLAWGGLRAGAKDDATDPRPAPDSERMRPPEPAPQQIVIVPEPGRMGTEIWTDHNVYYNGSKVRISFRATRDAYVYIFDTDTYGVTRQIFPNYYDTDNFVRGGSAYSIPDRHYSLTVSGPPGHENLEIVAVSERPQRIVRDYEDFSSSRPFPEHETGASGLMRALSGERPARDRDKASREDEPRPEVGTRPADEERSTHTIPPQSQTAEPDRSASAAVRPEPPERIIITPPLNPLVIARAETSFRISGPRREDIENGSLNVTSYPSRARVYLDGRYMGTTPRVIALQPGSYEVRVEAAGFLTEQEYYSVRSDEETRAHFFLRPEPGERRRAE